MGRLRPAEAGTSRLVSVRRNFMSTVCVKYKLKDIFLGRFCWYIYS